MNQLTETATRGGASLRAPELSSKKGVKRWMASRRWYLALAVVAACYSAVQLLVTARVGLGWDESIYVSQVTPGLPPAWFSAPRARGVPLLVAPVTLFTSSVIVIRVYLSLLSGLGLFLAYYPWVRLRPGAAVPAAAALFAGLWTSLFYGSEAMPNIWVAFCAVAGAGLFSLYKRKWSLVGIVVAFAIASLVRPTDASWLALPLVGYGLVTRRFRAVVAVVAGLVVGWGEWFAEAALKYGGPFARLSAAGAKNEAGLHFSLGEHLRALDGPILCRFGHPCGDIPLAHVAWFAAIPVLAAVGLWAVRKPARRRPLLIATASGAALALSYIFTIGYAAPRFLLPAYALLALPVACGLASVARARVGRVLVAVAMVAFFALQGGTLLERAEIEGAAREPDRLAAEALRGHGITRPCFLYGHAAIQVGYLSGCGMVGITTNYGGYELPRQIDAALTRGEWVGVLSNRKDTPAAFLSIWHRVPLITVDGQRWYLYRPPQAR
ncbi:hypothetical protein [Microtetraspora sp. NBRC 16547]|uniref:hypothetical protein n=1 Tax=Microtetraspora sp. NBRC 16547 TaxID=3030993 RepID=UPI0024A235C9|nr:hypothetical protein [Microtetraspora sp. NBRC 16547]GLW99224.1 hypothetical protein Misp02_33110 [Microtetraspora sp. NBRC 16547]